MTMTKAEHVAGLFDNDNDKVELERGLTIHYLCEQSAEEACDRGDLSRFEFPDGSAIVAGQDSWAIEGDELFSGLEDSQGNDDYDVPR